MDEKQPISNGRESADRRFEHFVALKTKFDIHEKGFSWYVDTIGHMIDFAKVFDYLGLHPDALAFAPQLDALVRTQLAFQKKIKQYEMMTPDTLNQSVLAELTQLSQDITDSQKAFNVQEQHDGSNTPWDAFNTVQHAAIAGVTEEKESGDQENDPHNWEGFGEALMEQGVDRQSALDVERLLKQIDRIISLTRRRREQIGLSHKEAKAASENYALARSETTKIKNRLKKLQSGDPEVNIVTEIAALRTELAEHLNALRAEFPIQKKEAEKQPTEERRLPQAESEILEKYRENNVDSFVQLRRVLRIFKERMQTIIDENPSYGDSEKYKTNQAIIVQLDEYFNAGYSSDFDFDTVHAALHQLETFIISCESGAALSEEEASQAPLEDTQKNSVVEPMPEKKYEERLALRNDWMEKKDVYETLYATYLADQKKAHENASVFQKFAFWKKENMPQGLLEAEQAYGAARKSYASSLDAALLSRIPSISQTPDSEKHSPEEKIEGLRAALANRFVLKAAHDKLAKEKLFVPEGKSLRVFEDLQRSLHKHKKLIRAAGYVTVAGVALASGGVGAVVVALGAKTLQTKVSAIVTAAGATGGAYLGNRISEEIINYRERKRDDATEEVQMSFSIQNLDSLEKAYLGTYRAYEQAVRNKKYMVGAGAIAGGVLGAVMAHNLHDIANLHETVSNVPSQNGQLLPREQLERQLGIKPTVPNSELPVPVPETSLTHGIAQSHEHVFQEQSPITEARPAPEMTPTPQESIVAPEQETPLTGPNEYTEADESSEYGVFANRFTFEPGSKVDTVSEALYETWKQNPDVLDTALSKKEFLSQMYGAMARIEASPTLNHDLLEQMHITSGNLDKVHVGQTINLQPFFDYLKNNH